MKRCMLLLLLTVAVVFAACYQKGTVMDTKLYDPYRIADADIPFADDLNLSQFDRVSKVEQDDLGRCYYIYTTYSCTINENVEIHIISQTAKDGIVYYYPDDCYIIRRVSEPSISASEIDKLKERNDWKRPLQMEKMQKVTQKQPHKDVANEQEIRTAMLQHLGLRESFGVLANGLEIIGQDQQIFFVYVFPRNDQGKINGMGQYYLVLYQKDATQPILRCQVCENALNCQETVKQFRQSCEKI